MLNLAYNMFVNFEIEDQFILRTNERTNCETVDSLTTIYTTVSIMFSFLQMSGKALKATFDVKLRNEHT